MIIHCNAPGYDVNGSYIPTFNHTLSSRDFYFFIFLSIEHKCRGGHSPISCQHAAITLHRPSIHPQLSSLPMSLILSPVPFVPAFSSLRFSNSTCVLRHSPPDLSCVPFLTSFSPSPSARGIVCLNMTPLAARAYKSSLPLLLS